ncbi:tetratricopeptide repeat protein 36 homolog [Cimex lectularius]|uniref:Tetratricopeptide repeat protein 36 n=1 Tax=Cimex lectularius TaxID=79782 RepID=A0A8I6TJQ8_CIMLE|nr:tetratricopeptide repeat protein 36 homolog [Cimex lectularius]
MRAQSVSTREEKMSVLSENDRAVLNSIFNPLLPLGEGVYSEDLTELVEDVESENSDPEVKELEKQGVLKAEEGKFLEAVDIFSQVILKAQTASAYNNRAQAYRLLGKDKEAMDDLNKSLEICQSKGRSGCNALCQRGLLHRKCSRIEQAKRDFEAASRLGSHFAKQQLVEMNPYAAMCNQMLNEMMSKLSRAEMVHNGHGN